MTRRLVVTGRSYLPGTSTLLMVMANDPLWTPQPDPNPGDEPYIDGDQIRKQREEDRDEE